MKRIKQYKVAETSGSVQADLEGGRFVCIESTFTVLFLGRTKLGGHSKNGSVKKSRWHVVIRPLTGDFILQKTVNELCI